MSDKDREFWREVHKALEIITKAVVRFKLSARQSDESNDRKAA